MRLSETFLQGFGIYTKSIRPIVVLDVLDSLLQTVDITQAINNIEDTRGLQYKGDKAGLEFISKDPVLVKLLDNKRATNLYLKLLTSIILGTSKDLTKDDLSEVFEGIYPNSRYRALTKAVDTLNDALDDTIIMYSQYADRVTFVIVKGNTEQEYKDSLVSSGYQSPQMIDKLCTILIVKGVI